MLRSVAAGLLAMAFLAGCAGERERASTPSEDEAAASVLESQFGQDPTAAPTPPATSAASASQGPEAPPRAFLLAGDVAPGGSLAGFRWRVPEGALVPHEVVDDWSYLYLVVLPIVPAGQELGIQEWDLVLFEIEAGQASLLSIVSAPTLQVTDRTPVLGGGVRELAPTLQPLVLRFLVTGGQIQAGDEWGLVVAAQGDASGEFGFLVRVAESEPDYDSLPASAAEFGPVAVLPRAGEGTGLQTALYADSKSLAIASEEVRAGPVQVEEHLPVPDPAALTLRDVAISAAYDRPGWSYGAALYLGAEAHGHWDASVEAHGALLDAGGIIAQDWMVPNAVLAELILLGLPGYIFTGDGEATSSSTFSAVITNVNEFEALDFVQFDLGAPLGQLLQAGGLDETASLATLVGDVVPPSSVFGRGTSVHEFPGGMRLLVPPAA